LIGVGLNVLENGIGFVLKVLCLGRGGWFRGYAFLRDGCSGSEGRANGQRGGNTAAP